MILRQLCLPWIAIALGVSLTLAQLQSDIPPDALVSDLISTAHEHLANGATQEALNYLDAAIAREPKNYLALFRRGATFLSLGRSDQAEHDFDRVLQIRPGFPEALLQRAKIRRLDGRWNEAREDYAAVGEKGATELNLLSGAETASNAASQAKQRGDWEFCIIESSAALTVAPAALHLRSIRADCSLEHGDTESALGDLQYVAQRSASSTMLHLQVSSLYFYGLGEAEKGLAQARRCLHSDPDSKTCRALLKCQKALSKKLKEVEQRLSESKFYAASKILVPSADQAGLIEEVKVEGDSCCKDGLMSEKAPRRLYDRLIGIACQAFIEMDNWKRSELYCTEALQLDARSLHGIIYKAKQDIDREEYESAQRLLNEANGIDSSNQKVRKMLEKVQTLMRRSKQKDYYKVLGLSRDADDKEIKRAYRRMTLRFHPDKISAEEMSKEQAEKKMASINEAYEVLGDPGLKERYDNGDDPNSPQQGTPFQGSPFGYQSGGQPIYFRQGQGNSFQGAQFKFQGGGFQFPPGFGFP